MDNITKLATEWWRIQDSFQKTIIRKKYRKGVDYKYYTLISIQDIREMYEAEHASIRYNLDISVSPVFQKKEKLLREFKEEWSKAMMAACNPPSPILNSVKFYEESIENWTKRADRLRGEIKELQTKSTWDKEEVKRLMVDSFNKGVMAEAFSLPIDFDADKWIEEEINKTINSKDNDTSRTI